MIYRCPTCDWLAREPGECLTCETDLVATNRPPSKGPRGLRLWQTAALEAVAPKLDERPVIQAVMGAGKSYVVAELARAARHEDWHVVVTAPNQLLVRQLAATLQDRCDQPVGQWYAERQELWPITIVCQMSLHTYEPAWRAKYNLSHSRLWIADECHKTECDTVLEWGGPRRRVGFTATPYRAANTESITSFGELAYKYGADDAWQDGVIVKPKVHHLATSRDLDDDVAAWVEHARQTWGGGVVNATSIADAEEFARSIDALAIHSEGDADVDAARAVIRDGGVVVYVDMLAEGFDCPEIMWMALRRPVGSRVRFAQEVGRGLRSAPDKPVCHMLDVHDLWNTHSLQWREALGEIDSAVVPALQLDFAIEQTGWIPEGEVRDPMPPTLLSPLRSWVRSERISAAFEGRVSITEIKSRSWRSDPCSKKQLAYLDDVMRQVDPSRLDAGMVLRIRTARAAVYDCVTRDPSQLEGAFRKGDASDLIDVVRGLR